MEKLFILAALLFPFAAQADLQTYVKCATAIGEMGSGELAGGKYLLSYGKKNEAEGLYFVDGEGVRFFSFAKLLAKDCVSIHERGSRLVELELGKKSGDNPITVRVDKKVADFIPRCRNGDVYCMQEIPRRTNKVCHLDVLSKGDTAYERAKPELLTDLQRKAGEVSEWFLERKSIVMANGADIESSVDPRERVENYKKSSLEALGSCTGLSKELDAIVASQIQKIKKESRTRPAAASPPDEKSELIAPE